MSPSYSYMNIDLAKDSFVCSSYHRTVADLCSDASFYIIIYMYNIMYYVYPCVLHVCLVT